MILILLLIYYWTRDKTEDETNSPVTSLQAEGEHFTLNGKPFRILSGAIHYFRVVPTYWRDRLLKLKAMGLNTVETYVAWNVHEPRPGTFEFSGRYDVTSFINLAHTLGLYVILRPGPYICAEWEFGGLPAWLLADSNMEIRSTYAPFMKSVEQYFDRLIPLVAPLQMNRGGPIIAVQIENEYGSFGSDTNYLSRLTDMMTLRGITELLFTSDNEGGLHRGQLPGVFKTINFQENPEKMFARLKESQGRRRPLFVTEYWSGWFDHWGEQHHIVGVADVVETVGEILRMGASINFYMFHGGTNFGFMNGGNYDNHRYQPTVTSYDYDAPLSEAGDVTPKYIELRRLMLQYSKEPLIDIPPNVPKSSYGKVKLGQTVLLSDVLYQLPSVSVSDVGPMEMLPHCQLYGYVMYRTTLTGTLTNVEITGAKDFGLVMIDSKPIQLFERQEKEEKQMIKVGHQKTSGILDILVENSGRINYGSMMKKERKGIEGSVLLDGKPADGWTVYSLEFLPKFFHDVKGAPWKAVKIEKDMPPAFYKGTFTVIGKPRDTFLKMSGWVKGVVAINGAVLGRFWNVGPQQTLYVPASWLVEGANVVMVFCIGQPHHEVSVELVDVPILG